MSVQYCRRQCLCHNTRRRSALFGAVAHRAGAAHSRAYNRLSVHARRWRRTEVWFFYSFIYSPFTRSSKRSANFKQTSSN